MALNGNLQDHIHLSTSLDGGPELAPDIKWKITNREHEPQVIVSLKRSLTGRLKTHRLRDEDGVIQFNDYKFRVLIADDDDGDMTMQDRYNTLLAMNGNLVYFVDIFHVDDGEDHTEDVVQMFLAEVAGIPEFSVGLPRFYAELRLVDAELM